MEAAEGQAKQTIKTDIPRYIISKLGLVRDNLIGMYCKFHLPATCVIDFLFMFASFHLSSVVLGISSVETDCFHDLSIEN